MNGGVQGAREPALSWFFRLERADQVRLLSDPAAAVAPRLVAEFGADASAVVGTRVEPDGSRSYRLRRRAAAMLTERRAQLLAWWNRVPTDRRGGLLAHRHTWLPAAYREFVADSGTVVVERHVAAGGIEERVIPTPMMQVFLHWQAEQPGVPATRGAEQPDSGKWPDGCAGTPPDC
ncbi:hypothetical protein [Nocardia asteroides]|uniref:hypothetical protein n=1 Tax=Nocardia asteroides TaxID=1824 RepID=UPI001E31F238|nr:hypothetical protein [Nocardia asteroides]UGT60342.1 hypothetical protein LTT61_24550 [Nocardia asteroides]